MENILLDDYLLEHYQSKSKKELERETGIPFHTLKYKALKLGLKRSGLCNICNKNIAHKKRNNKWVCGDCFWDAAYENRCEVCGKLITKRSTRCVDCNHSLIADKNRKHPKKYCKFCDKPISYQSITCGSKKCMEKLAIEKGTLVERTCEVCNKKFLVQASTLKVKAARFCSQKCYKEVYFPSFNKRAQGFRFNNIQMRSSWEVRIASLLDQAGIKFEYEKQRFNNYIPDFYLPDFDIWIEVKGFLTAKSLKKIIDFRHTGHKIYIITSNIYSKIKTYEDIVQFLNCFEPAVG